MLITLAPLRTAKSIPSAWAKLKQVPSRMHVDRHQGDAVGEARDSRPVVRSFGDGRRHVGPVAVVVEGGPEPSTALNPAVMRVLPQSGARPKGPSTPEPNGP